MKEMQLETERLILRQMRPEDFYALYEILSDEETMQHYPKPFDQEKVEYWIRWNRENYETFGFGLFAVILKENGKCIGDCGITMQTIHGKIRPEIGYHIHKDYQRKGYASEAAKKCKEFIFEKTTFNTIYTYMKYTNVGSYTAAVKNGMRLVDEYEDEVNTITRVYAITRAEYLANISIQPGIEEKQVEEVISWTNPEGARFLRQWAGEKWQFPLQTGQVLRERKNIFSIKKDGRFVGMMEEMRRENGNVHMGRFILNPDFRGGGVGSQALLKFCSFMFMEESIRSVTLVVYDFNTSARKCYEKCGFQVIDEKMAPGSILMRKEREGSICH